MQGKGNVPAVTVTRYEVSLLEADGAWHGLGQLHLDADHHTSATPADGSSGSRLLLESLAEALNSREVFQLLKLPPPDAPNPGSHRFDAVARGTPAFALRLPEIARSFFDVSVRRVN